MKICIQDPATYQTYLLGEQDLLRFQTEPYSEGDADVLFVLPTQALLQELPASRLTDSLAPAIQIVDTEGGRTWRLTSEQLQAFAVAAPPSDDDVFWFAMPSARQVLAAVPVFRKALVQHSS
jgi:hypothetical protein